ncbi:MAG: RluA family pseudouridine synthase [Bacteroidota bacterium]|nr:RluA family pseudouridine synthase [Bacteroidota bacterium]
MNAFALSNEQIIYQNDEWIAINKPAGMLSIPDRKQTEASLKDILIKEFGAIYTVHRLDKETSGVIVFAKTEESHKQLSQLFEKRDVTKIYNGLVHGIPHPLSGTVDVPVIEHFSKNGKMMTSAKGKPAVTGYETLKSFGIYSWMQFQIHTGRTHQIRVHMQHLGNSVVCDDLYGNGEPVYLSKLKRNYNLSKKEEEEQPILKRLALHSALLEFVFDGNACSLEAALPKDLKALLKQLEKWKGVS